MRKRNAGQEENGETTRKQVQIACKNKLVKLQAPLAINLPLGYHVHLQLFPCISQLGEQDGNTRSEWEAREHAS